MSDDITQYDLCSDEQKAIILLSSSITQIAKELEEMNKTLKRIKKSIDNLER